jgi:inorganic triphosphatase YgiF
MLKKDATSNLSNRPPSTKKPSVKAAAQIEQSRLKMHRWTLMITKIDSVTNTLEHHIEQMLSLQCQHTARAGYWGKLMTFHKVQDGDELDNDEERKTLDVNIELYNSLWPSLDALATVAWDINWAEIDVSEESRDLAQTGEVEEESDST